MDITVALQSPEKAFVSPEIIFRSHKWIDQISLPYLQLLKVHSFEKADVSGFDMWKFMTKEDLNPQKQVFLFNLRRWLTGNPKIWSIFYGKKFI